MITPFRAVFQSFLPFWITCPQCKTKLTLRDPGAFWQHMVAFVLVLIVTVAINLFRNTHDFSFPIEVSIEGVIFVALIAFRWMPRYGLRPLASSVTSSKGASDSK
jgi:uncharacterized protein (DUF983 family)